MIEGQRVTVVGDAGIEAHRIDGEWLAVANVFAVRDGIFALDRNQVRRRASGLSAGTLD